MIETELRKAMSAEVADVAAPAALLAGVKAKRRRRHLRNGLLGATSVVLVTAAIPLILPDGHRSQPLAATPTTQPTPSLSVSPSVSARPYGTPMTSKPSQPHVMVGSADGRTDGRTETSFSGQPGRYELHAQCDSVGKIKFWLGTGQSAKSETVDCTKGLPRWRSIRVNFTGKNPEVGAGIEQVGDTPVMYKWQLFRLK